MSLVHLVDSFVIQRAIASGVLAMATVVQSTAHPSWSPSPPTTTAAATVSSNTSDMTTSDVLSLDSSDINMSEVNTSFRGDLDSQMNRSDSHCQEWQPTQQTLFQTANLFYAVAFLIPHNFRLSMLLMRTVLVGGFFMFTLWSGVYICAPDIFAWNFTFMSISLIHVIYLSYKHFPPRMKPEYTDLYDKLFKPLKMDKQHFTELFRDAEILVLEEGARYATEDVTAADERLSILLNGKLKVTCEDTHLHYIMPNQFLDSPEWEACPTDGDQLFQVTITAMEPSQYVCWQRRRLHLTLRNKPFLDSVIYNLIGKDITQKLYSLNEHMNPFSRSRQNQMNPGWHWKHHFPRSLSVDMVHTGTKGHVRSHLWRTQSRRNSSANSDSLGSSPARTSRHSHLSDPGPHRSPLRIPSAIVSSNASLDSVSGSGSDSVYVTAASSAPLINTRISITDIYPPCEPTPHSTMVLECQTMSHHSEPESDLHASTKNPTSVKHKVHFPERGVSHAVFLTAGWISDSFRRMNPSESYAERVPLWDRVSNQDPSVQ